MISIDSNVLVRVLIDDGSEQQIAAARRVVINAKQVFIPTIVQIELVWVLARAYQLKKEDIKSILHELANNAAYVMQEEDDFAQALELFKQHNIDFSDCLIKVASRNHDALPIHTFDKKFARLQGVKEVTIRGH